MDMLIRQPLSRYQIFAEEGMNFLERVPIFLLIRVVMDVSIDEN